MLIFRNQQKTNAAQLEQVTAVRDRVRSMCEQMRGREMQLTDLFSMLSEDERKVHWSLSGSPDQADR